MIARFACVLAMLVAAPAYAELSAAERQIGETVEAEYERSVSLLEKLVKQNSGTMNLSGVKIVGEMMRAELEPLGFQVRWVPQAQVQRSGHLIATHQGLAGNNKLLLIAHLDTVFEKDSPFTGFVRAREKATGPGSGDDKGGMVVIVAALRAMHAAGTLADANIEIVLTGDEEDVGEPVAIARADLIAAGKRADIALGFEGLAQLEGRDMGSIARRSSNAWTLTTSGTTGHSSLIFNQQYGDGAVFELARILAAFRTQLPEPNLTFNVGLIAGGDEASFSAGGLQASASGKTNIIPAVAIARGDFRTLSLEQTQRVQAKMRQIVADHAPGTDALLEFDAASYPPMAPTEGNRALLTRMNQINADLGLAPMGELDPLRRGAGDISFVAPDVDGLVGMGTASEGDHAPGETVDLDSIRRQAKRAAILMTRLSRQ